MSLAATSYFGADEIWTKVYVVLQLGLGNSGKIFLIFNHIQKYRTDKKNIFHNKLWNIQFKRVVRAILSLTRFYISP